MESPLPWVDAVLSLVLLASAASGAGRGASGVAGALLGAALGLAACAWVLPRMAALVPDPVWAPVATVVAGLLLLVLGEGMGLRVGAALRRGLDGGTVRRLDGLAGAALAAAVCLVLLGVLAPRMAPVLPSGVVAETGRSRVLAVAERAVPEPVDRAADDLQAAVGEVVSGLPPLRAPVPPDRTDVVRA